MRESLPADSPGTALFPQYSGLAQMVAAEVEGLTDAQLDWESDRWEWSKWSIRSNVSHMASLVFRWLLVRWGTVLFIQKSPFQEELSYLAQSTYERRLDRDRYWGMNIILEKLAQALELAQEVLAQETVMSLHQKEIISDMVGVSVYQAQLYPQTMYTDSQDSSQWHITLEATFRHMYYEITTHLYNVHRLKRAQGLSARVTVPQEGYWIIPEWDRSEP